MKRVIVLSDISGLTYDLLGTFLHLVFLRSRISSRLGWNPHCSRPLQNHATTRTTGASFEFYGPPCCLSKLV